MQILLEKLKDKKLIDLVTHPENEKAIKLYESLGFKKTGLTFHDDGEQVSVNHLVGDADTLARVLDGFAPDPCIPELLDEFTVELVTYILNRAPPADDERLLEVGFATVGF